jgi:hypothetical protein
MEKEEEEKKKKKKKKKKNGSMKHGLFYTKNYNIYTEVLKI